jgi:hypothetical protein
VEAGSGAGALAGHQIDLFDRRPVLQDFQQIPLGLFHGPVEIPADVRIFDGRPAIVALAVDDASDGITASVHSSMRQAHVRTRAHHDPGEAFELGAYLFDPVGEYLDEV